MINFFRNIEIDRLSFWLGAIAGALILVLVYLGRKLIPAFINTTRRKIQETREKLTVSAETHLRNDIILHAQKQHLTASFFALDEIALEPLLIAPPPMVALQKTTPILDAVHLTIPYAPDWPEMAATYRAPTISLIEALEGQANLVLLGHPGSGKSFSLAWLATRIARKDPLVGALKELMPLYFHSGDIPLTDSLMGTEKDRKLEEEIKSKQPEHRYNKPNIFLDALNTIIGRYVSPLTLQHLPSILQSCLKERRAILIVDGLEDLLPEQSKLAVNFLSNLLKFYPGNRIVASGSIDNRDGMAELGCYPVALAAWGDEYKERFVNNWYHQWDRSVLPYSPPGSVSTMDKELIHSWLLSKDLPCSPLECTLKVWGAYAGDIIGSDLPSLIESYLRRVTPQSDDTRFALGQLALQMVLKQSFKAHMKDANKWMSSRREIASIQTNLADTPVDDDSGAGRINRTHGHTSVETLTHGGILISLPDSQITFSHPIFIGYLAGQLLSGSSEMSLIQDQPEWAGKAITLYFLALFGDISSLVIRLIRQDDFLHNDLLRVARWLRITPKDKAWRAVVLREISNALNQEPITLALSTKLVTAIALSGDKGVAILFRQLLTSANNNLRQIVALGCGLVRDTNAIAGLSNLLEEQNPNLVRSACLALVQIGDKKAMETVASELMHGSEASRRAAAEALANHPLEGHPALEEGSTYVDLMVRRAVIFGLARVNKDWANQILEKMQTEDKEWVVRNAAIQVVEQSRQPNPHIPQDISSLIEAEWLTDFAKKQGLVITDDNKAANFVLQALRSGTEDERLSALEYLGLYGNVESATSIYGLFFGLTGEIHEAAYQALWMIKTTGADLPPPQQFGYQ